LRGYQGDNWRMQNSLFDLENRYASLSQTGDPLERLNAMVDWGIFLPILERMDVKPRKSKAGRPVTCRIVMFKMLILQRLHALSDERAAVPSYRPVVVHAFFGG
jgi:transposase, IS5 family